jgi:hypothetical protein
VLARADSNLRGIALAATPTPEVRQQHVTGPRFVVGSTERLIVLGAVVSLFGLFLILELSQPCALRYSLHSPNHPP